MDVQVERRFVIPAPPTQPSSEVPFTVFDLVAPNYDVTVLYAFSASNPTNAALLDALTATLPRFPLLTARIKRHGPSRRPFFVTGRGGAGTLVVEASVASALADHLPLVPSPDIARLDPPLDNGTPHLLRIHINQFACGGLVVASSSHHQAADGYSMSTFLNAWADAVRAGNAALINRAVVPFGPGALVPRRPPRCEFEHRGAQFLLHEGCGGASSRPDPEPVRSEISNMMLHFPSEFVARLKASSAEAENSRYTTFETVTAHLWRKITVARGRADDDTPTSLDVSVNGRARLGPADEGFFGNAVLTAKSTASARDLARGSLADAAALVRAGVRAMDRRYFQSFIDFGEVHGDEELEPAVGDEDKVLLPDVASDSWLHLELHKLDFGCGGGS